MNKLLLILGLVTFNLSAQGINLNFEVKKEEKIISNLSIVTIKNTTAILDLEDKPYPVKIEKINKEPIDYLQYEIKNNKVNYLYKKGNCFSKGLKNLNKENNNTIKINC